MKNNILLFIVLSSLFTLPFYSCSDHVNADFTYEPNAPVCGQTIKFTDLSTGEDGWKAKNWDWSFGNNSTSIAQNPTYSYPLPGVYTVKLKVNSSNNATCTKKITVYDSIPTIYAENTSYLRDTVDYYTKVKIKALVYNPYAYDVTYFWTFPSDVYGDSIVNGHSTAEELSVYFSKSKTVEKIQLHITVGDSAYDVSGSFYVNDVKAPGLLMVQKTGNVLRQRMYELGTEEPTQTTIPSGKNGLCFATYGTYGYLFNAGDKFSPTATGNGDGSIRAVDFTTGQVTTVISNSSSSAAYSFYNGSVDKNYIYWTDYQNYVYRLPRESVGQSFEWKGDDQQTQLPYYLIRNNRLGYYGNGLADNQINGSFACFDQMYMWAKGGTGKGIYRFFSTDILTSNVTGVGTSPTSGAILTSYSIRAFAIDQINQKIYFSVTAPSDKVGFWVANFDGTNPQRIDDAPVDDPMLYISGIVIDNASNSVYWAYRSPETLGASAPGGGSWASYYELHPNHQTGVKKAQLATVYKPAGAIKYFAPGVQAYGIALDEVKK